MYRENLENKINKLQSLKEVKELGQIRTQSSLDHEMAEMLLVEKMSYFQSQMHFDESMESTADSDLEDGECCRLHLCMPKELLGNQMQWSFRRER